MNDPSPRDDSNFEPYTEGDLPFGMCGVTGLLDRLRSGSGGNWAPRKKEMVARYLLDLSKQYWLSTDEADFCNRFLKAA
jgi:hypothetical protein